MKWNVWNWIIWIQRIHCMFVYELTKSYACMNVHTYVCVMNVWVSLRIISVHSSIHPSMSSAWIFCLFFYFIFNCCCRRCCNDVCVFRLCLHEYEYGQFLFGFFYFEKSSCTCLVSSYIFSLKFLVVFSN